MVKADFNIKKSVCFTGHRPEKMSSKKENLEQINHFLRESIINCYNEGYRNFISGMARGVDIMAAELVLKLKEFYPDIKLICAIAFPEQASNWCTKDGINYQRIINSADEIFTINNSYSDFAYIARDSWMVNNSNLTIAVYNGDSSSGTASTLRMSNKLNHKLILYKAFPRKT